MKILYLPFYFDLIFKYLYLLTKNCDYAYFIKTNIQYKESLYVATHTDSGRHAPKGTRKNLKALVTLIWKKSIGIFTERQKKVAVVTKINK